MANAPDDNHLIRAALAGNPDAFGRLVARYQDRLFHAMVHISGTPEDARDSVQDAFVQAFLKLESFRGDSAFYTWVYRIAFNLAASRRRRTRPSLSLDDDAPGRALQVPASTGAPSGRLEQQEQAEQVRTALAGLDEEYRTVLVLREMDELSYEEIAEILDMPIGTVRSRLHRARGQLRELLKEALEMESE